MNRIIIFFLVLFVSAFAKAQINEVQKLDTVLVGKIHDPLKVMGLVKSNLESNLQNSYSTQKFEYYDKEYFDFDKLNIDLDKATALDREDIKKVNEKLRETIDRLDGKLMMVHDIKKGAIYSFHNQMLKSEMDTSINMVQAKAFDFDNPTSFVTEIIGKALDPQGTYSVHSGWFKIDDDLDHNLERTDKKRKEKRASTRNKIKDNTPFHINRISYEADDEFSKLFKWSFIQNQNDYDYVMAEMPMESNDYCYLINFRGNNRRAKFTGFLKVDSEDYGIHHLSYRYRDNKRGQHLNVKWLLGVKFSEDVLQNEVTFSKDTLSSKYNIKTMESKVLSSIYVHRPIKIKRQDKREKIKFDIKFQGVLSRVESVTFVNRKQIDKERFMEVALEHTGQN